MGTYETKFLVLGGCRYDCLYIWGPNQSWWSWDDADDDKLAHVIDESKCTYNSTTWDIDCI